MNSGKPLDVDVEEWQEEWDGVYYDASTGDIVEFVFHETGVIHLIAERDDRSTEIKQNDDGTITNSGDEELIVTHTFDSFEKFADATSDFHEIPPEALETPVKFAQQAYEKGYQQIMSHSLSDEIAVEYADRHVELVDTRERS